MRLFGARLEPQAAWQTAGGGWRLLALAGESLPRLRAGQCVYLRLAGSHGWYLRHAYFPLARGTDAAPALLLPDADPLAQGDCTVDGLAPAGNGFALQGSTRRLLLAGDAARLAPLLSLAHEATRAGVAVTLLVQGGTDESMRDLVGSLLPLTVEYQLAARVAPLLAEYLDWSDQLCVAGDAGLTSEAREAVAARALPGATGSAQALAAPGAGCGYGVCLGCAVAAGRGLRLVCTEGPVFELSAFAAPST